MCLHSLQYYSIVYEYLARATKQEKEIKWIQIRKEEVKLRTSADDMILYLKDSKDSTKKLLDLINTFSSRRTQNQHTKKSIFSIHHQ
jgi:hypothetical protein